MDLALLIGSGELARQRVADALRLTYETRKTHALSSELPPPPPDWRGRFRALAEECALPADMDAVFTEVRAFFDRVLGGDTGI
jgi:hypothetical protein